MNEGILFEIIRYICSCRQQAVRMYTRDYKRIFAYSERHLKKYELVIKLSLLGIYNIPSKNFNIFESVAQERKFKC